MNGLRGQVALVTGAGSGIGRAVALGLARKGVKLCITGRRLEALEAVAETARAHAAQVLVCPVDLTVDSDIRMLEARVEAELGGVDILVHCAGVISLGGVAGAPIAELDRQYCTNVRAAYLLTQSMLPQMRSRRGQIVFINSSAGLTAKANASQYAATKHAAKAIADSLREEVNDAGMRVLSVFLGRTASPLQAAVHEMEGRAYRPEQLMQPEDVAAIVISALILPRSAEVTEISMRPLIKSY